MNLTLKRAIGYLAVLFDGAILVLLVYLPLSFEVVAIKRPADDGLFSNHAIACLIAIIVATLFSSMIYEAYAARHWVKSLLAVLTVVLAYHWAFPAVIESRLDAMQAAIDDKAEAVRRAKLDEERRVKIQGTVDDVMREKPHLVDVALLDELQRQVRRKTVANEEARAEAGRWFDKWTVCQRKKPCTLHVSAEVERMRLRQEGEQVLNMFEKAGAAVEHQYAERVSEQLKVRVAGLRQEATESTVLAAAPPPLRSHIDFPLTVAVGAAFTLVAAYLRRSIY